MSVKLLLAPYSSSGLSFEQRCRYNLIGLSPDALAKVLKRRAQQLAISQQFAISQQLAISQQFASR